ncbi:hypothetical protein HDV06_001886 [Boothiomyces sp. JEL0866]|nr:hypothetical protein HDV06_001886 [Boothiomyces sp. JEL0866]
MASSDVTEKLSSDLDNAFEANRLSLSLAMTQSSETVLDQHNFVLTSYSKPTYCDLCSKFIWGLAKQGCKCTGCGYNTHKKCKDLVMTPCHPIERLRPSSPTSSRSSLDRRSSVSEKTEMKRSNSIPSRPQSPVKKESSLITELFAESQVQARKLGKVFEEANPSLSIGQFLKNNNRFVARQGPLIWINQAVINLLTWKSVPHTLIFILCYIIICLHPILIPILPQLALIYLMVKFYHYRADNIMNGHPLPKPHITGTAPKLSPNAQELKEALQNIQNTMAHVSDAYDAGYNLYRAIDWSNPEQTQEVLKITVASAIGTIAVVSIIPLNLIALFAGLGIFVANTAIFKAASSTLAPVIVEKLGRRLDHARKLIMEAKAKGEDPIIDISLYENQRWWAGVGWVSALLQNERKAWSDGTGTITLPSKDNYELPAVEDFTDLAAVKSGKFEWIDEDWELDTKWTETDEQGWVYTNQSWGNPKPNRILGSFTRRRKWVRHMRLVAA